MKLLLNVLLFIGLISLFSCNKDCHHCSDSSQCADFTPSAGETTNTKEVKGYYYDNTAQECVYYEGKACSKPPFELLSECKACECD